MAISSNLGAYLQLKLSGGLANSDGNSSLGGQVSSKSIISQTVATLLSSEPSKKFGLTSSVNSNKARIEYYVDNIDQEFVNGKSPDPFLLGLTWLDSLPSFFQNLKIVGLDPSLSYSIFLRKVVVSDSISEYYAVLIPDVLADSESYTDVTTQIVGTKKLLFNSIPFSYGIGYPTWTKFFFDANGSFIFDSYVRKILTITKTTGATTSYMPVYSTRVALPDVRTLNGYVEFNVAFSFANGIAISSQPIIPEFDNCSYVFVKPSGLSSFKKFSEIIRESYKKNTYSVTLIPSAPVDSNKPDYRFNTGLTGISVLDSGGWSSEEQFSIVFDIGTRRLAVLEDRWQKNMNFTQSGNSQTLVLETTQDLVIDTYGWLWGDWCDISSNGKYKIFNNAKTKWISVDVLTALLPSTGVRFQVTDVVSSNKKNELFDSIKRYESHFGDTEYRCFYVVNTHLTETMWDIKIYINSQPVSGTDTLQLGLDPAPIGDGFTTGVPLITSDENSIPTIEKSITSITSSGTTATVTCTNHEFESNYLITISGATPEQYNGQFKITKTGVNTFTYTMLSGAGNVPASGTLKANRSVLFSSPTKSNPLLIGDLEPLKCKAVWLKRVVPSGVEVDVWDDWSSIGVSGLI